MLSEHERKNIKKVKKIHRSEVPYLIVHCNVHFIIKDPDPNEDFLTYIEFKNPPSIKIMDLKRNTVYVEAF
jgi:hypothetical protein